MTGSGPTTNQLHITDSHCRIDSFVVGSERRMFEYICEDDRWSSDPVRGSLKT